MIIKKTKNKGFTLVEMLVAISLFIVVVTISIGAILTIFDANRKAQSSKTVVDNLNFSLEDMVRTIRFGKNFHCSNVGNWGEPRDCSTGDSFFAITFNGVVYGYWLDNGAIKKVDTSTSLSTNITSPEVNIESLKFYVFGSSKLDSIQPYVIVFIKGKVGVKETTQTSFSIQTMVSQRALDI